MANTNEKPKEVIKKKKPPLIDERPSTGGRKVLTDNTKKGGEK